MRIINTGGTFNKIYDPIKGQLVVPCDNRAIEAILRRCELKIPVEGIIYKDSLDMDEMDRKKVLETIQRAKERSIIVVHGTDTMDQSAAFIASHLKDKMVIFTGAMVPFSIDPIEATLNLSTAIAHARSFQEGVFIAMHGLFAPYDRIYKDRQRGIFCLR